MRYLNKIIFINSADKSLKYAELELDGNTHFIGTQGVGKSTLLRAILFFYNANTQKLGIPREKKNYNEYYFPYQNSYIIYEVETEIGKYCVMSFKTQGRVAFRFINSAYNKKFFIDQEGRAYETFDKIREALGNIHASRIVNNYEEYRDILYGNNKGLSNEFKKYALLESRQYQNIPRTIANVFLNAKLDAEFVKETIIKSLNEEVVKIDLTTYSQTHLKNFEANLNDIKKWTQGGLRAQAEKVNELYSALKFIDQRKRELSRQLGFALKRANEKRPQVLEQLKAGKIKQGQLLEKLNSLALDFEKKKEIIQKQIGEVAGKLKEIIRRRKEYEILNIEELLNRVAQKSKIELEKTHLLREKDLLTTKFMDIKQRYEAQLKQLENRFNEFKNGKELEKNEKKSEFLAFKEELNQQYQSIYDEIRKQHQEDLKIAQSGVSEKDAAINEQKIGLSVLKHKRFYEAEIKNANEEQAGLKTLVSTAESEIVQSKNKLTVLRKEWELEEKETKTIYNRKIEQTQETQGIIKRKIEAIDNKISNSENSFYDWLNKNIPNWMETIGKVIDEEKVLFLKGLNPKRVTELDRTFYGVHIDTNAIDKQVITLADLKQEKEAWVQQIAGLDKEVIQFQTGLNEDLEKLKRKYQAKIKEEKDVIQAKEYEIQNNKTKIERLSVKIPDLEQKAEEEKNAAIQDLQSLIGKLNEEKIKAKEQVQKIENNVDRAILTRQKEKTTKIKEEQSKLTISLTSIEELITRKYKEWGNEENVVKMKQNEELEDKGADTKRINEIDLSLSKAEAELNFIESNRDKVAEYKKDKRELFDKEGEFKTQKSLLDKKLDSETQKQKQQKDKLTLELSNYNREIDAVNTILTRIDEDLAAYEEFKKMEIFEFVEALISDFTDADETDTRVKDLIKELHTTDNSRMRRYTNLQEAISRFSGNFQENNIFKFKLKFNDEQDYFEFADMLKEFVEEDKIGEFKKRVEERFAHIIHQIGKETQLLIEKEGEISKVINEINNDFVSRQFVTAVKSVELKTIESKHKIFTLLVEIKKFNDENLFSLGAPDLFSSENSSKKNEKAIALLVQLIKEMNAGREREITLSDSFDLQFKIVENDNDTGWVEKLTNVGSEGTDVLVKAMINIMLLNVFKEKASKKQDDNFRLHCMMDEIGKLHPNNVKGILKFANDRNILLINSSPTSLNATDYRYTYLLSKDVKNVTSIRRLVKKYSNNLS